MGQRSHGFFLFMGFFCFFFVHDTASTSWHGFTEYCIGMAHVQYLALSKIWHSYWIFIPAKTVPQEQRHWIWIGINGTLGENKPPTRSLNYLLIFTSRYRYRSQSRFEQWFRIGSRSRLQKKINQFLLGHAPPFWKKIPQNPFITYWVILQTDKDNWKRILLSSLKVIILTKQITRDQPWSLF